MITSGDVVLARLSEAAYGSAAPVLPAGFRAVSAADLDLVPAPGASFAEGRYRSGNAAALVVGGSLNGTPTLVVAFRGSDDREDSINALTDPGADYADFAPLLAAVDAQAAADGYARVVATGHSLGGALAQVFMAEHSAPAGALRYGADSFGSPGALLADGPDARVTNFVVADDPVVFLGENRAEVAATLRSNPLLAGSAALVASAVFPGLSAGDALGALRSATADYENRGATVLFPGADGETDPISGLGELLRSSPDEHRVELYVAATSAAAQVARLYDAALDRAPDQGGSDYYIGQLLRDRQLATLAQNFLDSPEFAAVFGTGLTSGGYVALLYEKALNRGAGAEEIAYYVGALDGGTLSRAQAVLGFSESPEHVALVDLQAGRGPADQGGIAFA